MSGARVMDIAAVALVSVTLLAWWLVDGGAASPTVVMGLAALKALVVMGVFLELRHGLARLWLAFGSAFAAAALAIAWI